MKASMGGLVKKVLSNPKTAKILTSEIISQLRYSDVIKVKDVLPDGKILVLKRVRIDN